MRECMQIASLNYFPARRRRGYHSRGNVFLTPSLGSGSGSRGPQCNNCGTSCNKLMGTKHLCFSFQKLIFFLSDTLVFPLVLRVPLLHLPLRTAPQAEDIVRAVQRVSSM